MKTRFSLDKTNSKRVGKKVSFNIDKDAIEPTHGAKSEIWETIEIDQAGDPLNESESARAPLVKIDSTKRLTRGERDRVERDKVYSTITPNKAKGTKSRINSTKSSYPLSINPEEGEDDLTSLKSYGMGESSKPTPIDCSSNVDQPITSIKGFEPINMAPRIYGRSSVGKTSPSGWEEYEPN